MKWFNNLKITNKLMLTVSAILALTGILGFVSLQKLGVVNGATVDMASNWLPSVAAVDQLRLAISDIRRAELQIIDSTNREDAQRFEATMTKRFESFKKAQAQYEPLISSPEEKTLYNRFQQGWEAYMGEHQRMISLMRDNKREQAWELHKGAADEEFHSANDILEQDVELNSKGAEEAAQLAQSNYKSARMTTIVVLVVSLLAGFGLARLIAQQIAGSIGLLVKALKAVEAGDLTQRPQVDSTDELGEMCRSLGSCIDAVRALAADAEMLSKAAVEGKLSTRADACKHQGEYP